MELLALRSSLLLLSRPASHSIDASPRLLLASMISSGYTSSRQMRDIFDGAAALGGLASSRKRGAEEFLDPLAFRLRNFSHSQTYPGRRVGIHAAAMPKKTSQLHSKSV